jgi:tetratricopeptide (TPR) repeat protein
MAVATLLLSSGCASTSHQSPAPLDAATSPAGQSPREQLEAIALRQRTSPDSKAQHAPPPPGFDAAQLAPLSDAELAPGAKAVRLLADVVAHLVPKPAAADPGADQPGDAAQTADPAALREYIAGRTALLSGKAAEAMNRLENASKLDPASGSIWRELAEAQSLAGRRASAVASYQRALRTGNREPRVLRALGRDAWRAERADEAAALLAESIQRDLASGESIWPPAGVDLGQALAKLGYLQASAEVLEASLADAPTQIAQSRDRLELGEVLRRRSELWTVVGDTWARLKQPEKATQAWEAAFNAPGSDALGLLSRRVYTEMLAGHSANAALSTLDLLASDEGVIDERLLPLLHDIGEHASLGDTWPRAVAALGGAHATPSNRSRLARAAAASTPDAEAARAVLLDALRAEPFDTALLDALMPLRDASDVAGRISDLEQVVNASPLSADLCARALIFDGRRVDAAITRLADSDSDAGRLIRAAALDKLGRPQDALALLSKSKFAGAFVPAVMALRASLGAELARPEEVSGAIATLEPLAPANPDARRALAMALESAQRAGDALNTLAPDTAPDSHPSCTLLIQAADLANQNQDPKQAQELLERAIAADRFDERAYAPLLGLLTGPNASDQRAASLVRSLRDAVPNSRLIRLLQGRELASRGLWPQAETLLLGLMTEDSEDVDALGLLAGVWERAYSATPDTSRNGLAWLQARLAKRPDSPPLIAATARVLAATGKAADAESLLAATVTKWPITDMARLRESIVRDSLSEPDKADELAKARLEAAPPTPANSFELAQLLLRKGETGGAIQALRRGFPGDAPLSIENGQRIVAMLSGLKPDALAKATPADAEAAVGLFDLVVKHGVPMSAPLHGTRLTLLAAAAPNDASRLADAADQVAKSLPDARTAAYLTMIGQLQALDNPAPALGLLREAAARFAPQNQQFLTQLFVFTCVKGSAADGIALARDTKDPKALLDALASLNVGDFIEPQDAEQNPRAEIAYLTGTQMSSVGHEADAEKVYRYALELQPDHAWACNNLGYLLLEQGRELPEAERLIEQAWKKLPDSESVTDSLAWVRYKRGQFNDEVGPDGSVVKQGALTLLDNAVNQLNGNTDWTILDHYGDVLFRTGKATEARKAWTQSQSLLKTLLQPPPRIANLPPQPDTPFVTRQRELLKLITQKLEDVDAGRQPSVAPTWSDQPPAKP